MTREEAEIIVRQICAIAYDRNDAPLVSDEILAALAPPPTDTPVPLVEVTLSASAWRSLVSMLDAEGAEHDTPISVCYDAEHDQAIYWYAEYPDDGAMVIPTAPPAASEPESDWYIESRVDCGNYRGTSIRFIREWRDADGKRCMTNRQADLVFAERDAEIERLRAELSALREGVRDVLKVVTDFVARDQALIRLAALVKGKP